MYRRNPEGWRLSFFILHSIFSVLYLGRHSCFFFHSVFCTWGDNTVSFFHCVNTVSETSPDKDSELRNVVAKITHLSKLRNVALIACRQPLPGCTRHKKHGFIACLALWPWTTFKSAATNFQLDDPLGCAKHRWAAPYGRSNNANPSPSSGAWEPASNSVRADT